MPVNKQRQKGRKWRLMRIQILEQLAFNKISIYPYKIPQCTVYVRAQNRKGSAWRYELDVFCFLFDSQIEGNPFAAAVQMVSFATFCHMKV